MTPSASDLLLREAVSIIHCHLRNTHKDFLQRARDHLRRASRTREETSP